MKRTETYYRAPAQDQTGFYYYHQNNSGGRHVINENVTLNVVIEAYTPGHADELAEELGINFADGCSCCGSRWDRRYGDDAPRWRTLKEVEAHYADVVWSDLFSSAGDPVVYIYAFDGRKIILERS